MIKSAKIIRIRADLNLDYASNDEKNQTYLMLNTNEASSKVGKIKNK